MLVSGMAAALTFSIFQLHMEPPKDLEDPAIRHLVHKKTPTQYSQRFNLGPNEAATDRSFTVQKSLGTRNAAFLVET